MRYFWDYCVSTHSRPKAAGLVTAFIKKLSFVSTHSRPKAAGAAAEKYFNKLLGFNTQPPEGGWLRPKGNAYTRN